MKENILVAIFILATQYSFAQIPFEVMVGNKQTQYFAYIQKDLDSIGRWNIFSQAVYAVNYKNISLNSMSIDNQFTYQFNHWLGVSAGGGFDGLRFNPLLGVSLTYFNKKGDLVITAFPTVQFAQPRALDMFALINYSPQFNKKWGLFFQSIVGSNLGMQKESPSQKREILKIFTRHNISTQLLRIGFNYKQTVQFGIGADLAQFGKCDGTFNNLGFFLRYQLKD